MLMQNKSEPKLNESKRKSVMRFHIESNTILTGVNIFYIDGGSVTMENGIVLFQKDF